MRGVEVRLKKLPLQVGEEGNWYIVNPEAVQKVRQSRQQNAGHEGPQGDQPGTPREGQELEGRSAPRVRTDADLPLPRLEHFLDCLAMLGQEEEEEIQVLDQVDGESGGAEPLAISDGGEKDAPRQEAQEEEDPAGKESASEGKGRRHSGRSHKEQKKPNTGKQTGTERAGDF